MGVKCPEKWGGLGLYTRFCSGPKLLGRLLAAGLTAWIGYQAIVNMGMVMGLVPVVGVPLPLVSYGGSAMVTAWIALGLLQSVRRFGTRF